MWYVYVLKSLTAARLYTGMSENIFERLKTHNSKKVKSTKAFAPWELIYQKGPFENAIEARKCEKYLKSSGGKKFLNKVGGSPPDQTDV